MLGWEKDRKDIDKDGTLYYVHIIFYIKGVSENEVGSIFFFAVPINIFSTTFILLYKVHI